LKSKSGPKKKDSSASAELGPEEKVILALTKPVGIQDRAATEGEENKQHTDEIVYRDSWLGYYYFGLGASGDEIAQAKEETISKKTPDVTPTSGAERGIPYSPNRPQSPELNQGDRIVVPVVLSRESYQALAKLSESAELTIEAAAAELLDEMLLQDPNHQKRLRSYLVKPRINCLVTLPLSVAEAFKEKAGGSSVSCFVDSLPILKGLEHIDPDEEVPEPVKPRRVRFDEKTVRHGISLRKHDYLVLANAAKKAGYSFGSFAGRHLAELARSEVTFDHN
jgi:hypothetical protein